jgi:hypothetical protein
VREFHNFINVKLGDDVVYGVLNNLKPCISELLARQYILNEFGDDVVIRYEPSFLSPCDAMFKFMLPHGLVVGYYSPPAPISLRAFALRLS